jgi:hypothetical protein
MSTGDPARIGDWFVTYTGKEFYPLDPHLEDFCIEDIAHSLSLQTRWMGHCKNFYSIASHSLACARVAEKAETMHDDTVRRWCLMHDAAEAYTGDIVRPIKGHLGMIKPSTGPSDQVGLVPFKVFEEKLLKLIAERFGLPWPIPDAVKEIDNRMLVTEARANTTYHSDTHWIHQKPWQSIKPYANDDVLLWQTPQMAEEAFLKLAREYLRL